MSCGWSEMGWKGVEKKWRDGQRGGIPASDPDWPVDEPHEFSGGFGDFSRVWVRVHKLTISCVLAVEKEFPSDW